MAQETTQQTWGESDSPAETAPTPAAEEWGTTDAPATPAPPATTPESESPPASLTAFKAMHASIGPDAAHGALALAQKTGLAPAFVADNLDDVRQQAEHADFTAELHRNPIVAGWAAQSPVHAVAAKEDIGPLGKLERLLFPNTLPLTAIGEFGAGLVRGLEDIGQQEFATAQMTAPTEFGEDVLRTQDEEIADFNQKHIGMAADLGRSVPSLGLYYLTQKLGERAGGVAGGAAATGAMMFALNRGSLYRQIMQQMPIPESDADGVYDPEAYEKRARTFATAGAGVSAALGAGLSSALSLALPGAAQRLQGFSNGLLTRAFTDEATRDIVGRLADIGGHTLWGALMMAVPAVSDDATVRKAVSGSIDWGNAAGAGWEAFKRSLIAAGTLSTLPHARPLLEDIGRMHRAPVDAARLGSTVDAANESKLVKDAPAEAEPLIAKMAGDGDLKTVYIAPDATENVKIAQKIIDALGDDGRAVAEAQEAGHDVAVPIEKYLTTLADAHDEIREDVKLTSDGMTSREAEELRRELDGWQKHAENVDPNAKTIETPALPDLAAEKYGGTPEQWAEKLTPETVKQLQAATGDPAPAPPSWGGRSAEDWAAQVLDWTAIGEIQPGRYELAARRAADKLASTAKEGAERGAQAARTGFLVAGMQKLDSAPEGVGVENLAKAVRSADVADRRLAKLPMLERVRDLARAEAKRAAEVRDEMDRAHEYLTSRDAPEYRAQLNLAGPEYLKAFDTIVDAVDDTLAGSSRDPAPLDALLTRMQRDGQLIGFDEQGLRDVLTGNRGWSKLTPPEARNVVDAVKNIRRSARDVNAIALDDKRVALREVVENIANETADKPDIQPLKYSSGNEPPFLTAVRMRLNDANAKLLQFKTNVEDLGPTATAVLYDRMKDRMYYRDELARDVGEFYRTSFEKVPKEIRQRAYEETNLAASLPMPQGVAPLSSVRRTYLYLLRLHDGSSGNMDRVLGGFEGWSREAIDHVLYEDPKTRLTREELDFLQSMHDFNDQRMWPLAKEKQERLTGIAPPKVAGVPRTVYFDDGTSKTYDGGYWPLREDRGISAPRRVDTPGVGGIADFYGDNYQRAGLYNQSMKERAATAAYPVNMDWSAVPAHVAQVIHDLAMDEYVRDAGKLLLNPDFKAVAERKLGQGRADELALQLRRIATRRADSVAAEAGVPYKAMQWVRGAAIMAVMGDARMAVAQFSHIPGMLVGGKVSLLHGAPALVTMFKPLGIDADGMHIFPNWRAAYEASGELQHRDLNSTKRITESIANLPKATRPLEIARTVATMGLHLVDRYTSTWAWISSHNEGLAKGMSEEAAVKYADGVVEDIMPTHDIETAAPLLTNRTIGALLMMHGFGSTIYQLGYRSVIRPVSETWSAGDRAKAVRIGVTRGAQFMAMNAVLGSVWHALAHGRDKDESWDAMLERTAIGGQSVMLPFLGGAGEMLGAAITNATNEGASQRIPTFSGRTAPGLYLVQRGYDLIGKLASENREPDEKFFDALEATAAACRIPPQYPRTARYLYDLVHGDVSPRGPLDAIGSVYRGGNYSREPREQDLFTELQDKVSGD